MLEKPSEIKLLFTPITVRNLTIRNRVVMSSMDNASMTRFPDPDKYGHDSPKTAEYYRARAKGGVGMINSGYHFICRRGQGLYKQSGIHSDDTIPGIRMCADAVHAEGGAFCLQINHAGRETKPLYCQTTPEAPSSIAPSTIYVGTSIEELTKWRIKEIETAHADAALRAKKAGCDAVEAHFAHGYLAHEFWSSLMNKRTDEYGCQNIENATRFARETLEMMREAVGPDMVIGLKISGDELIPDIPSEAYDLDWGKEVAKALLPYIDYIIVSAGLYWGGQAGSTPGFLFAISPMSVPLNPILHLTAGIKEEVNVPVGALSSYNDPFQCEAVLQKGYADFIVMGRQLIADPDWANKAREGRFDDIRTCMRDNLGCINRIFFGLTVACTQNAEVMQEKEAEIKPADKKKKVMIIGGGIAGMEAARVCALRGHDVTLYEKRDELGGMALLASMPPKRADTGLYPEWLKRQVSKLGVKSVLNTAMTPELAKKEGADALIVATGAVPIRPNYPGSRLPHVVDAFQVLREEVSVGPNVVLLGYDSWAFETAEWLAEKGHNVTIVASPRTSRFLGEDPWIVDLAMDTTDSVTKAEWIPRMFDNPNLAIKTFMAVKEITPTHVVIDEAGQYDPGMQETNYGPEPTEEHIPADTVVCAIARRPTYVDPYEEFEGAAPEVYAVGECVEDHSVRKPRMMFITKDAYFTALKI
jgi:2,4-dienoyl-CoA reductase-like NADH-dependent reductase (Old Yellow Enzyme family)/thioredoxin reductase